VDKLKISHKSMNYKPRAIQTFLSTHNNCAINYMHLADKLKFNEEFYSGFICLRDGICVFQQPCFVVRVTLQETLDFNVSLF
jgi:hypothetical protein